MNYTLKAVELSGRVDEQRQLHLDEPLPQMEPRRVRVLILFPEDFSTDAEIDEEGWLRAAANNSALAFLSDRTEDVYTLADGKPFHDEGYDRSRALPLR